MTPAPTDTVLLVGFEPALDDRVRAALARAGCPRAETLALDGEAPLRRLGASPGADLLLLADRDGPRDAALALLDAVVRRRAAGEPAPAVIVVGDAGSAQAAATWIRAGAQGWLDAEAACGPTLAGSVAAARMLAVVETERRAAEVELRRVHESLSLAQRAGRAGLFDWRIAEGPTVFLSAEYRELIGLDPHTPVTLDTWLERLHPDDRDASRARVRALLERGAESTALLRVRDPRGTERWLSVDSRVERDAAGRAVRLYGIAIDVGARRRQDADMRFRETVGARMAVATDPVRLTDETLAALVEHLEADACAFAACEGDAFTVEAVQPPRAAAPGIRLPAASLGSRADLDGLASGQALATRLPADLRVGDAPGGDRAALVLPARADGRLRGVVLVLAAPGRAWDAEALALAADVTARLYAFVDRLRTTAALARSERVHRRLAEVGLFGVGFGDSHGHVSYVNDEMLRMMGRTRADFEAGRIDWAAAIAPECLETARREAWRLHETGTSHGYEGAFLRPDGGRTPYLAAAALVHPGEDLHVSIALDLTRVRAAETRATAAAEALGLALQGAGAGAWTWDLRTGRLTWSPELFRLYGFEPAAEVPAVEDWAARVHPEDLPRLQAMLDDARARRRPEVRAEFRIRPSPGVERWVLSIGRLGHDAQGQAVHLSGIDIDVTERQRAVQAERESTRLLRAVLETTTDLVWMKDLAGRITMANAATVALLGGGDPAAVFGRDPTDLFPDRAQAEVVLANDRRILAAGRTETVDESFGPPAHAQVFQSVKSPLRDDDGRIVGLVGVSRDITGQRRAEQELAGAHRRLEESYALLDTLFDGAPIGLAFLDTGFRYVRINRTLAALNGLPVEAHVGRHPDEVIPEIWRAVRPYLERVRETGEPLAGVMVRAPVPGRAEVGLGWWLAGYFPVRVRGELFGFGITAIDVTDQKRAEEALRAADARKDDFLATLAHELRNPLAPIVHAAGVLQAATVRDPGLRPVVQVVERQAVHMSRLIDDLLDVSRISRDKIALRRERLDLRDVVTTALEASRPWIERMGHAMQLALPDAPLPVDGDPVRLAQVVSNLLTNAAKYTPRGGHVRLSAAPEGADAVVTVADDGVGIAAADRERVFEMFSQVGDPTGSAQGGLGIGLWLVRRLVALHGGRIDVDSDGAGRGSRFMVRLPLVHAPAVDRVPARAAPAERAGPAAALQVLVVDDNADAAETLAMLLSLEGHRVAVAGDGPDALAAGDAAPPDVVLLDIGLPGPDGHAVCRAMRTRPWGLRARIVAVTGWGQAVDRERSRDAGFDEHLTKPVDDAGLRRALRRRDVPGADDLPGMAHRAASGAGSAGSSGA